MNNDNPTEQQGELVDDPNPFTGVPTVKIGDVVQATPDKDPKLNTIRTFQSDLAGAVKTDNVSVIKMALAEKERREKNPSYQTETDTPRINKAYILTVVVVVVVFIGAGGMYFYFNRPPAPTLEDIIAPLEPELLYSETQVSVRTDDLSPSDLITEINKANNESLDVGTVRRILLTTTASSTPSNISVQDFLKKLRSRAPDSLLRTLSPYFVIGAYSFNSNEKFILLKTEAYDNAYASMLTWEQYMESDIGGLFGIESNTQGNIIQSTVPTPSTTSTSTSTAGQISNTSTSTSSTTQITLNNSIGNNSSQGKFIDKILQNKDTRVFLRPDGSIGFLYSFIDKNTLVITSSEQSLKEILFRTTTGRIIR